MAEPEDVEEDLFADLYDADDNTTHTLSSAEAPKFPDSVVPNAPVHPAQIPIQSVETGPIEMDTGAAYQYSHQGVHQNGAENVGTGRSHHAVMPGGESEPQGTGIKEDGKMFIGGLNWETTDQSLKDYFSQFGEVQECTVMRDSATGRSRGFGFLTFRDPKTVNTVMVKEHYLDGKIIDPKRAIPRDEQEKTSKIFVGGVSQDANEHDFKDFFAQFGRVIDATLMIDKDTGRPRGFGFVTFDSEAAVEAALSRPLEILGKPIEVKKAQPRGNLRDEEDRRYRRGRDAFREGGQMGGDGSQQQAGAQGQANMAGGLTPQMMAQYWQRMQQYFALMQQQMAVAAAQGQGMGGMGMGGMSPAMMQQMQMKQMQQMQMGNNQPQGSLSPPSQSATPQAMPNMMNPAMMQQMQQMQQMQNQGQGNNVGGMPAQMGNSMGGAAAGGARPGYNAQEQIAFEQQKYEQQQVRRAMETRAFSPYQQGGPTSWEGMYDEVPQPNIPTGPQAMNRAGSMGRGMYIESLKASLVVFALQLTFVQDLHRSLKVLLQRTLQPGLRTLASLAPIIVEADGEDIGASIPMPGDRLIIPCVCTSVSCCCPFDLSLIPSMVLVFFPSKLSVSLLQFTLYTMNYLTRGLATATLGRRGVVLPAMMMSNILFEGCSHSVSSHDCCYLLESGIFRGKVESRTKKNKS